MGILNAKLRNMTHALSLDLFIALKGTNFSIIIYKKVSINQNLYHTKLPICENEKDLETAAAFRPDMTEKLLTRALSLNTNKNHCGGERPTWIESNEFMMFGPH